MWKRGYQLVRAAIPNAVFEGPSLSTQPNNGWHQAFLDYIKANNVVPNYMSWHDELGNNDPYTDANGGLDYDGDRELQYACDYDQLDQRH
jgi:hypothetical protein